MASEYISYINFYYVLYWIVAQLCLLSACYWLWKSGNRWSKYIFPVLIILMVRLCLFENVASWAVYYKLLGDGDTGFRQNGTLNHEIKRFLNLAPDGTEYLAVGTSQTGSVFRKHSKKTEGFHTFALPGMGPLDMYLYRNYIKSYKPENILLFISEFDLARKPDLDLAKISPPQRFELINLWPDLLQISKTYNSRLALNEMVFGEFSPEYKYSFIFEDLTYKFLQKKKAFADERKKQRTEDEYLMLHVNGLVGKLNEPEIAINIKFLRKFLSFCRGENIRVVILEGQYHPLAYTPKTLGLNAITKLAFHEIAEKDSNVSFIPRNESVTFTAPDYIDAYHVKGDTVDLYVASVMEKLERMKAEGTL